MTNSVLDIRVQDIDHLGIVAGIIDEMGLVEQINQLLGTHPQEMISPGQAVKAMILNGLGLVSAPLYLFEKFFVGKATEHLLGEGISPAHLNDDRLGRVLDKLYYETGLVKAPNSRTGWKLKNIFFFAQKRCIRIKKSHYGFTENQNNLGTLMF
jgi:transposase